MMSLNKAARLHKAGGAAASTPRASVRSHEPRRAITASRLAPALALCVLICAWGAGCAGDLRQGAGDRGPTWTPGPSATPVLVPSPGATATIPATATPTAAPALTATPTPTFTPMPTVTPTPTPDPRRYVVAFVSDRTGDDDVYLYDLDSGAVINLTRGPGEDRDPAFAPDGRSLVYRSNVNGTWAFYRIDLATGEQIPFADGVGGGPRRETDETAYRGRIACDTLRGDRCVYETYRGGYLGLELYAARSTLPARQSEIPVWGLAAHPAGDYDPAWRPNTGQVAFASWRDGQKDLYMVDVESGHLDRLTQGPGDDESPAWHPGGQRLAFVRWIDGDADLYEIDLSSGAVVRLTGDPYPDRSPTYGPDGRLFWTRYQPGEPFEVHDPYRAGRWQLWTRDPAEPDAPSPNGAGDLRPPNGAGDLRLPVPNMDVYTPAAALALWPDLPPLELAAPTPTADLADGEQIALVTLDIDCAGSRPQINARVADAYEAWRAEVLARTGHDVLGQISDMFRPLGYSRRDYGHLSWHRTGRALDLLFEWYVPGDDENKLIVVREDLGPQTYWRLYLKTREQDGTMGEPLTEAPWVFWFSLDPAEEAAAFDAGGRPGPIPAGYYVDLTRLARRHGWHRIASYEEEDFDWRTDSVGREFWHYQRTDGLTWWDAMLEIYPLETVEQYYGWSVCVDRLGMDPAWLAAKGIPAP